MEPVVFGINRSACRLCWASTVRPAALPLRRHLSSPTPTHPHTATRAQRRLASSKGNTSTQPSTKSKSHPSFSRSSPPAPAPSPVIKEIQALGDVILKNTSIPTEEETLKALGAIESAAQVINGNTQEPVHSQKKADGDPASALLSLDASLPPGLSGASTATINALSSLAYDILKHQTVFITPSILSKYVSVQTLLQRPSTFPEIFSLYTSKPKPSQARSSKNITYTAQNSKAVATAIPSDLAESALDSAILQRDLPLSLEIIAQTFRTPSFKRNKLFRKALPPAVGAALAPVAAYSVASTVSTMQLGLPPEEFTMFAFAGLLTYGTAVGTIGYVALTTTNDQMERVTWATGMPLWERWVREEERAACDRVAKAWGFREKWRWGEEVGAEWDELRDWLGFRGMVLDKVGLMEGME